MIAHTLVIGRHMRESPLTDILNKLEFRSSATIAAWLKALLTAETWLCSMNSLQKTDPDMHRFQREARSAGSSAGQETPA
jgi:hypothetical protein